MAVFGKSARKVEVRKKHWKCLFLDCLKKEVPMIRIANSRNLISIAAVIVGVLTTSFSLAGIIPNSKCVPNALPVVGCDCPLGPYHADRCKGTLPKMGECYGDVMCWMQPSANCVALAGANGCGIVVNCPCITCGTPITCNLTCECIDHPEKPLCTNSWGTCNYSP